MDFEERSRGIDMLAGLRTLFGWSRKLVLGISGLVVIAGFLWQMEVIRPGAGGTARMLGVRDTERERSSAGSVSSESGETGGAGRTDELPISLGAVDRPADSSKDVAGGSLREPAQEEHQEALTLSPRVESAAPSTEGPGARVEPGASRRAAERQETLVRASQDVPRDEGTRPPAGPFSVHVSSHASRRAAADEVNHLLRAGYAAFSVPAHRDRVRVLVGSFRTQTEAAREAQRLRREGRADLSAVLRLPYTLRMSAFDSLDAAEAERRRLREVGYFPYILAHTSDRDVSEYVVALGAFSSENEAKRFSRRLEAGETSYGVVTR